MRDFYVVAGPLTVGLERYSDVRRAFSVHVVGAHVSLWEEKRSGADGRSRFRWVTWLPQEIPHVSVSGVLRGRRFELSVDLWRRKC